jgi:hypothetical protein
MAQQKREAASKRTYRFEDDLIARLAVIAKRERRTITAQIELFLWAKVREEEAKAEKSEGNRRAVPMAA